MDDKGQVYFNADDKEIPAEDAARLETAMREEALAALREYFATHSAERERREREYTPKQQAHEDRLRARRQRLAEQARIYTEAQEEDRAREQEKE